MRMMSVVRRINWPYIGELAAMGIVGFLIAIGAIYVLVRAME